MSSNLPHALVGVVLLFMGLAAFLLHAHLLRRLIAFNVMGGGVFLVLLALAPGHGPAGADPVAQALILTGIVVSVAATGLALALARQLYRLTGRMTLDDEEPDERR